MLILLCLAFVVLGVYASIKVSPYVEFALSYIWEDPMVKRRLAVARRVKELCVDSDTPDETAVLIISKEYNMMERQVQDMLRGITCNPAMIRMALGGRIGNATYQVARRMTKS